MNVSEFAIKVTEPGVVVLDVRTPDEFAEGHIKGAQLIDYQSDNFKDHIKVLDKNATYAVYCRSGNRSGKAISIMNDLGIKNIFHLDGGVIEWSNQSQPLVVK